jgi:hypothetical protein
MPLVMHVTRWRRYSGYDLPCNLLGEGVRVGEADISMSCCLLFAVLWLVNHVLISTANFR